MCPKNNILFEFSNNKKKTQLEFSLPFPCCDPHSFTLIKINLVTRQTIKNRPCTISSAHPILQPLCKTPFLVLIVISIKPCKITPKQSSNFIKSIYRNLAFQKLLKRKKHILCIKKTSILFQNTDTFVYKLDNLTTFIACIG